MSWMAHLSPVIFLLICVKYVRCECTMELGMKPKIIDGQHMRRMLECRAKFGNCGRSFPSPVV